MLAAGKMVGFIPTKDYAKARAFYEGKLEFQFVSQDQYALVLLVGGHMVRIVRMPNFTPLQATILGWEVEDVRTVAIWLRDRGVETEKYPWIPDKELGIWEPGPGNKVAWFKDPDGNVLSISQHGS
jgi:catechol 2,3-dioxygenase-like lactoylglutathione lyase family enzyme